MLWLSFPSSLWLKIQSEKANVAFHFILLQYGLGHVINIPIFNYEWTVNSKGLTLTARNGFAQMAPCCDTPQTAAE